MLYTSIERAPWQQGDAAESLVIIINGCALRYRSTSPEHVQWSTWEANKVLLLPHMAC
jgi:hypothetical protein